MDTALNHSLYRHSNFGLEGVVDHVLKLLLGLDLVIQHTERDVFQESQSVLLPVYRLLLVHDRNQKRGFLIFKRLRGLDAIFLILFIFLLVIVDHHVVSYEKARDCILKQNLVNLACLEIIYRF